MKKYILLIALLLIIILSCFIDKKQKEEKFEEKILYKVNFELDDNYKETYNFNGRKIYLVGLNNFLVFYNGQNLSITEIINENKLEDFINSLKENITKKEIYKDGGTIIYKNENKRISNNSFTLILCNKILKNNTYNNDIYFGNIDMELKEEYCKEEFYD